MQRLAYHPWLLLVLLVPITAFAQPSRERSTKKALEEAKQSDRAARVFNQIMATREKSIPRDLLQRAEAVGVFPGVLKGGFIVGGRRGAGVISRRVENGWSAPAFFDLTGGSIGLQIGAASTDYVLLFMNETAVASLLKDKFEIGGEGSAAAGPVGRSASASTARCPRATRGRSCCRRRPPRRRGRRGSCSARYRF